MHDRGASKRCSACSARLNFTKSSISSGAAVLGDRKSAQKPRGRPFSKASRPGSAPEGAVLEAPGPLKLATEALKGIETH